ncbi:hypothetical protein Pfo_002001 [Paulownia fortunei]|nr:hypothetical protein Pfo_002001 [Paulownia fortunei]
MLSTKILPLIHGISSMVFFFISRQCQMISGNMNCMLLNNLAYTLGEKNSFMKIHKVIWHKPPLGWIKLNTYGSSRENPGLAGIRGVIRNCNGLSFEPSMNPLMKHRTHLLNWQPWSEDWCTVNNWV